MVLPHNNPKSGSIISPISQIRKLRSTCSRKVLELGGGRGGRTSSAQRPSAKSDAATYEFHRKVVVAGGGGGGGGWGGEWGGP